MPEPLKFFAAITMVVLLVGLIPFFAFTDEASLQWHKLIAGYSDEFPELKDDIAECLEDGKLSVWEAKGIERAYQRLKKRELLKRCEK